MLSSVQIAQIMQQQNATFMGAATHAQMISQQMPQPYGGGLGAYGGAGQGPSFQQIPFSGNNQRAGFNYGMPYSQGYGMGNDIAARGMAAFGGAASAGIGIAGAVAGMASLPMSLAAMPITAFGKHAVGSMVAGAQEQSNVERVLGQASFMNPASRTGRGFSRQDAQQIGNTIREMQHLPEAMTSMGELTRIMDKVIQSGQMQGVRDPQEFQRKFKSTVKTLKDVAQVMGTTMEEAVPLLQEARQSGFYGQTGTRQFMFQRQMTQGLTGMNQQQVNQTAQYGAQLGFATGGSRATGAKHAIRATSQIGLMNQMGALSNDEIAELTGKEGAEGIQEIGMTMTNLAHRMARSSIGTIMTVGLGEQKGGRYTGKMDQDLVRKLRSGQTSWGEMMKTGRSKIAGRGAKISYVARKNQMFSEMAGEAGIEGLAMMLEGALGDRFGGDEDISNIVRQRFGMNEREAEQVSKLMKKMPELMAERTMQEGRQAEHIARQKHQQQFTPDALKRKISKNLENVFTEPFKEMGVKMHKSIQESVDSFIDDLTGQYKTELTQASKNIIFGSKRGDQQSKAARDVLSQTSAFQLTGTGVNLGHNRLGMGGWAQQGIAALSGQKPVGVQNMEFLQGLAGGSFMRQNESFESNWWGGVGDWIAGVKAPRGNQRMRQGDITLNMDASGNRTLLGKKEAEDAEKYLKGLVGKGKGEGGYGRAMVRGMEEFGKSYQEKAFTVDPMTGERKEYTAKWDPFQTLKHELRKTVSSKEFKDIQDPMERMAYLKKRLEPSFWSGSHKHIGSSQRALQALTKGTLDNYNEDQRTGAAAGFGSTEEVILATMASMGMSGMVGGSTKFTGLFGAGSNKKQVADFLKDSEKRLRESFEKGDLKGLGKTAADDLLTQMKAGDQSFMGIMFGSFDPKTKKMREGTGVAKTFSDKVAAHRAQLQKEGKDPSQVDSLGAHGYLDDKQKKLVEVLAALPAKLSSGELTPEDEKILEAGGIDVKKLKELPPDQASAKANQLAATAGLLQNGTVKDVQGVMEHLGAQLRMGELMTDDEKNKLTARVSRAFGEGATKQVKDLRSQKDEAGQSADEVMRLTEEYASSGDEKKLAEATRKLTEMRSSKKKGVKEAADVVGSAGQTDLDSSIAFYGRAQKRLKKLGKKDYGKAGGLNLEDLGITRGEEGTEQEALYKQFEGREIKSRKQAEEVLSEYGAAKTRLKAGAKTESTQVDEKAVAKSLTDYLDSQRNINTDTVKALDAVVAKIPK